MAVTVEQEQGIEAGATGGRHVSPTRRALDDGVVAALIAAAFGAGRDAGPGVAGWQALSGGEFAAVARVALEDGREVVLKVGPAPSVRLLGYEHGMIGAEARYLAQLGRGVPGVPVARLLAYGGDGAVIDGEWMLVSLLPGRTLKTAHRRAGRGRGRGAGLGRGPDRAGARAARRGARAGAHAQPADGRFGYDDALRPHAATWPEAFAAIIEALLADAVAWERASCRPRPSGSGRPWTRHRGALAEVERACAGALRPVGRQRARRARTRRRAAAHGSGGRGAVPVRGPAGGLRLPRPARTHRAGTGASVPGRVPRGRGEAAEFTGAQLRRLSLYRMHLYLLMCVEMPSRGMDPAVHVERWAWLTDALMAQLTDLEGPDVQ